MLLALLDGDVAEKPQSPVPPKLPVTTSPITTLLTTQRSSLHVIGAEEVDDEDGSDPVDVGRPADPSQLITAALSAATRELLQPLPTTSTPTFPACTLVDEPTMLNESGFPSVSPVANVSMKVLDETKDVSDEDSLPPHLHHDVIENTQLTATMASSYTQDSFEEVDDDDEGEGLPEPHEASEHYSDGEFD